MPSCATCSRSFFIEEGGVCRGCVLLRKLGQELRFQPRSKLEARVAISWLESALRGLEVLRDSSHFVDEGTNEQLGLKTCPVPPSVSAPGSREASSRAESRASGERRRAERPETPAEEEREGEVAERPRRERRREPEDRSERDGKRRRRR